MKLKLSLFIIILFCFTSCSQNVVSNRYYSSMTTSKTFSVNIDINSNSNHLSIDETTFDFSNIQNSVTELEEMKKNSYSNSDFIKKLNKKIVNVFDNIGFNEEIIYNHSQKSINNNLLFTKRSERGNQKSETLLLSTTYFNSKNEFNPYNIAVIMEILRLFEKFQKEYNLSILFINNSSNMNNSIDSSINDILNLNIIALLDLQFEDTLNKVNLLNLDNNSKLSLFINESIKYNSLSSINSSEFTNKDNFRNIISNNLDFVRIVCEVNTNDITKCSNLLINIIADIMNKPKNPSVSVSDSVIRIYLTTSNHDTVKHILYKINDEEYIPITNNLKITVQDYTELLIKVQDLFGGESSGLKIKLY